MATLCKLQDLPSHLKFNPFVYKGYRPPMSTKECLKSLLYVHNETFNTYSHGTRRMLHSLHTHTLAACTGQVQHTIVGMQWHLHYEVARGGWN